MSLNYEIEGAIEVFVDIGPEYENYDESSECNVFKFETIEEFMNWSRISVHGEKQLYSLLNKAKSFWQVTDGPYMVEWSNFDVPKLKLWDKTKDNFQEWDDTVEEYITCNEAIHNAYLFSAYSWIPSIKEFILNE